VPFSNAWGIRGSCGGDVPIKRCRRDAETMRDLCDADVGISQQRPGSLDVIVREFRRPPPLAAKATGSREARLRSLADQAAFKFRERTEHVKNQPPLRGRGVEGFG